MSELWERLTISASIAATEELSLECGWCGGTAITSATGFFQEDDGEACQDCGFPGHVNLSEDFNSETDYTAYWWYDDETPAVEAEWRRTHPEKAREMGWDEERGDYIAHVPVRS